MKIKVSINFEDNEIEHLIRRKVKIALCRIIREEISQVVPSYDKWRRPIINKMIREKLEL